MPTYQLAENLTLSVEVAGDTSTPTQIKVTASRDAISLTDPFALRARICNKDTFTNATNATLAPVSAKGTTIKTWQSTKDLEISSGPVAATETLTISGVVIDGETVTLGTRVYEFDDDGVTTGSNVTADISSYSTASQGILTIAEPVTAGDTIQIGTKTYVFVANGTGNTDGEIDMGADEAATKVNIVAAINATDGYNTANADISASAFSADVCTLTALVGGVAGDALETVEIGQGLTHASNIFDGTTLGSTTAGVDCIAANAVLALVAAINGDASAVVRSVDGAGDTVDVTAITAGVAGNALASTETMTNGAFGDTTLSAGAASLGSVIWLQITDATTETVTLRLGDPEFGGVLCSYSDKSLNITHAAP